MFPCKFRLTRRVRMDVFFHLSSSFPFPFSSLVWVWLREVAFVSIRIILVGFWETFVLQWTSYARYFCSCWWLWRWFLVNSVRVRLGLAKSLFGQLRLRPRLVKSMQTIYFFLSVCLTWLGMLKFVLVYFLISSVMFRTVSFGQVKPGQVRLGKGVCVM